jgi:chromosome segregation ATPase
VSGNYENYQPSDADLEDTAKLPVLPSVAPPAADSDESRGQLEGNLRALTENLRVLEENLRVKSHELSVFEREVGARDRQIAELQSLLASSQQQHEQVGAANAGLQAGIEQLRAQLDAAQAERDQHAAVRAEIEAARAARERALAHATEHASQMEHRALNYLEALQTVEVQRQVFEGMVAERELQLQHTEAGAATRTADVESQLGVVLERERSLQSDLQFSRGQTAELDRQLRESLARHAALMQEMEVLRGEMRQQAERADGKQREAGANAARLERGLRDHMDMIQAMQQQHSSLLLKAENSAADLAAAEERIRSLQVELQQRDVRIERLNGIEAELRQQLAEGGEALAARDALIARLESETASSAAVLGSIQQNLEKLGHETVPPAATAAAATAAPSAAAPSAAAADAVVRLLVPVQGDQRVVHMLGRKTSIGRTPDNDLRINQDFISRHHAVILTSSTSAIIEDLNSTNGVMVNGRRVTRQVLNEGDLVTIGKTEFRFVLKTGSSPQSEH